MSFEVRTVTDLDEFTAAVLAIGQYFGMSPNEERMQRFADLITFERMHGAWSDGKIVGGAAAFDFKTTVPGGDIPTAGISVVGVFPTHRRRGILRSLMRAQLDDAHERGDPIASLWASEETIYGRFGYGIASFCGDVSLPREYTSFAQPFEPQGTIRLVDADEVREIVPPLFERIRPDWPGMFSRSGVWWEQREIADPEERRDGAGPRRWIVYEQDGAAEGYAAYRHKPGFDLGATSAELRVIEALGTSPEALRDIWGYLLSVDWIASVNGSLLPLDHPLFLLLANPRRLKYRMLDALWIRIVDVGAALSGREYSADGSVVFEVRDEFCPWNEGRWRLEGGTAERSDANTDLVVPAHALGSALLGGVTFAELHRAGRVEEVEAGALRRADAMFRWDRHPWCPEIF